MEAVGTVSWIWAKFEYFVVVDILLKPQRLKRSRALLLHIAVMHEAEARHYFAALFFESCFKELFCNVKI